MFSVKDSDVELDNGGGDDPTSLPAYNEPTSKITGSSQTPMLELGTRWATLHQLLGDRDGAHPLAFLVSGGLPVPALEDGKTSTGRYFSPQVTSEILTALGVADDHELTARVKNLPVGVPRVTAVEAIRMFDKLRSFVADAVSAGNGIVVHRFT